jgi:hypothetical protein
MAEAPFEGGLLRLHMYGAQEALDEAGKPFTEYVLAVKWVRGNVVERWVVAHRYSDFEALHALLAPQLDPGGDSSDSDDDPTMGALWGYYGPRPRMPPLPGKSVFGGRLRWVVDARRRELAAYMRALLSRFPEALRSSYMDRFLALTPRLVGALNAFAEEEAAAAAAAALRGGRGRGRGGTGASEGRGTVAVDAAALAPSAAAVASGGGGTGTGTGAGPAPSGARAAAGDEWSLTALDGGRGGTGAAPAYGYRSAAPPSSDDAAGFRLSVETVTPPRQLAVPELAQAEALAEGVARVLQSINLMVVDPTGDARLVASMELVDALIPCCEPTAAAFLDAAEADVGGDETARVAQVQRVLDLQDRLQVLHAEYRSLRTVVATLRTRPMQAAYRPPPGMRYA